MAHDISGPVAKPAGAYDSIRALLRAGRNDAAIVALCAITIVSPDDQIAKELLFDAFFQKRDWAPALKLAEQLAEARPDLARLQKSLVATLSNMKRFDRAIEAARHYIAHHGEDLTVLDALKVAYFYTGEVAKAVFYGQRALDLRDAEACRAAPSQRLTPQGGAPSGRNIISFSLWGDRLYYCYGAMINAVLSRKFYPDWICRFYVDRTVPPDCVGFLRQQGAELRYIEDEYPGVGLFQRFLVMNDATVGRFLVRDCDARLSAAEADLVRQWIDSGRPFHVIRDHVLHNELMIGCSWAGRADCGIDIVELMRRYFIHGPTAKYGHDQRMLGLMLWPLIRHDCLVHDKHYRLAGVDTVPLTDPNSHFGGGHQNIAAVEAEVDRLGIPRLSATS